MTAFSNHAESQLLRHVLGVAAMTAVNTVYVQLHTGDPGEDGTANVSAETERKTITFTESGGTATTSGSAPSWTAWDSGAETISHVSLWDASTAGNCLFKGALTVSKPMTDGDTFELGNGSTIALD